jgi:predicted O-methyltransferase YrrM
MRPSKLPIWTAIDGWLSGNEADLLCHLASRLPMGARVVEISTYRGRGTAALALGCSLSMATLTSIDHYQGVAGAMADWSSSPDRVRETLRLFDLNLSMIDLLAMPSEEAASDWQAGPIDLLFLDGSHDEVSVRADLTAWWSHVALGGSVCLHDYCAGHGDGVIAATAPYLADGRAQLLGTIDLTAHLEKLG